MLPCYIPRLLFVEEEPFPMDLNLEAAFDQPVDLSHQFDFPARSLERPELVSLSPVTFTGRLERQGPGFVLNGRVVFDGVALAPEDLDVLYYDDLVVPFDPLVEEQVQLELPLKALCRDDCRGLCPMCGADRNLAPCVCKPPADERWKSLRTLLEPGN